MKHIDLLGLPAKDKVTGQKGIISTVSFDLYGCIQYVITPPAKEGKVMEGNWMDVRRIEITGTERVMPLPDFEKGYIAEGKKGAADKPMP